MSIMSYTYRPFPLDLWVSRLLKKIGIIEVGDIDEKRIAQAFRIYLTYNDNRCHSYEEGRFKLININKNLDKTVQRERFFHELCHVLRHSGCQINMPLSFRELQEWDAEHFTRYAAIPFHMLKYVDFKSSTLISDMASIFKVSEELCQNRVDHIFRNLKQKQAI